MTNDSPQIQALRTRYRQSFSDKKAMIDNHSRNIIRLQSDGDEKSLNQELNICHAELHKLAGSLGMYKYNEMAVICRGAMASIMNRDVKGVSEMLASLSAELDNEIAKN